MTKKSKVLVIGGGSVGAIAALNLQSGGHADVLIVLRSNYAVVRDNGFTIDSCDHGRITWRPPKIANSIPTLSPADQPFDFVIITTKNIPNGSSRMASQVASSITPGITVIVLIQNGLNIEQPYLKLFPENIVLSGISMIGSEETSPGFIRHTFSDELTVGPFHNSNIKPREGIAAAKHFVSLYSAANKGTCRYEENVGWNRWKKLVYNSSMNPICALTGLDAGQMRFAGSAVSKLVRDAMGEIQAAATASGFELPHDIVEFMATVDRVEDHFVPSMLQDVRKNRMMEYEYLLGEPLREGQRRGVSMPVLSTLYALCEAVQWRIAEQKS